MKIDYMGKAQEYYPSALKLLEKLISFKTVLDKYDPNSDAPFGIENKKALNYLLESAKNDGFEVKNVDNYAGHIEFGNSNGEIVGILGHLDVVPTKGQNWESDPFTLTKRDGKLYARGSEDDKGPLVASYMALKIIKDLKLPVSKRARLIFGCDEESGSRCLTHYFEKEIKPEIGFSPDAEFPLIYGEKSIASFDIKGKLANDDIILEFISGERYNVVPETARMKLKIDLTNEYLAYLKENNYRGEVKDGYLYAYGIASHAMVPQKGLNASFILFDFLNSVHKTNLSDYVCKYLTFDPFGEKLGINIYDENMKELTMNVGVVNILNNEFKIGINCRIPVNNYATKLKECVENSFKLTNNDYSFNLLGCSKIHYVDPNSDLIKTLMNAYQEMTGDYTNKPFTIGGGTYAAFIDNAVAFGPMFPGSEDVCHIANEYIKVEDFIKSIAIYTKAIYDLIK